MLFRSQKNAIILPFAGWLAIQSLGFLGKKNQVVIGIPNLRETQVPIIKRLNVPFQNQLLILLFSICGKSLRSSKTWVKYHIHVEIGDQESRYQFSLSSYLHGTHFRAPAQNSRRHPSELCWRSTRSLAGNHQFAQVDDARFMEDDHVEEGGSKLQQQNAGYDIEINTDHQWSFISKISNYTI